MRSALGSIVGSALLIVGLVGCAEQGPAVLTGDSAAGASAPGAQDFDVDPCADVASCVFVGRADVDGDSTPDPIGIAVSRGVVTVAVAIDGAVDIYEIPRLTQSPIAYSDPGEVYRGAFVLSRPVGADLVMHLMPGGVSPDVFAVVTWSEGELKLLPPLQISANNALWYVQSANGAAIETVCEGRGVVAFETVGTSTAEGMPAAAGNMRIRDRYTFDGTSWAKQSTDRQVDTSSDGEWDAHVEAFKCKDMTLAPNGFDGNWRSKVGAAVVDADTVTLTLTSHGSTVTGRAQYQALGCVRTWKQIGDAGADTLTFAETVISDPSDKCAGAATVQVTKSGDDLEFRILSSPRVAVEILERV